MMTCPAAHSARSVWRILGLAGILLAGAQPAWAQRKVPELVQAADRIIEETNRFRKQERRDPLAVSEKLQRTARDFADFMARTDEYSHTADGQEPWDRAEKHEYHYCIIEENIAYEFSTAGFNTRELVDGFMNGWKKSPGHRANLLNSDVLDTGAGVAQSRKSGRFYAVQIFGRPRTASIKFEIRNASGRPIRYLVDRDEFPLVPRGFATHEVCRKVPLKFVMGVRADETLETTEVALQAGAVYVVHADGERLRIEVQTPPTAPAAPPTTQPAASPPPASPTSAGPPPTPPDRP